MSTMAHAGTSDKPGSDDHYRVEGSFGDGFQLNVTGMTSGYLVIDVIDAILA